MTDNGTRSRRDFHGSKTLHRTGVYSSRLTPWVVMTTAAALVALAGCAGGPGIRDAQTLKPGETAVFGRVIVVENGQEQKWGTGGAEETGGDFHLLLVPKGHSKAINARLSGDGSFGWALPPGEYSVGGYFWRQYGRRRSDRVWASFTVPKKASGVDIGTLRIEHGKNKYAIDVVDQDRSATEAFKRQVARLKGPPVKSIMKIDVPKANAKSSRKICDKAWGLPCEGGYNGVEPIEPGTSGVVASLQPTLKWKPAKRAGVRYDVVVYDTFSYAVSPRSGKIHGRIIDYAEGLQRPEHKIGQALKPKSSYYWAVRLREKDAVSSWSRYGSSGFYVVRFSSRKNHLYSFETPAK